MANLLEYVINVRDRGTAIMQRLGGAAVDATNRLGGVQHQSVLVASALRELGAPVDKLKQQLDKLKQERGLIHQRDITQIRQFNTEIQNLERQINSLENSTSQSKLSGWAKDAFSQIPFAGLLTNPLVVAGAIAGGAIKKGIEQDLNNSAFEVFLKSEEAAKKLNDDLGKIKMDKGALSNAAKQMLSQQVNQNDIMPLLSSMGDISGGQNDVLGSLALAYSQVNSAGRLLGQELNQLINAGFNPLVQMSKTTGKSVTQLKEDMGKGLITSEMVKQSFIDATKEGGQYHNLLNKMASTLGGKWKDLQTKVSNALLKVYDIIGPVAEKLIELGGAALDATFNGIGWLVSKIKEGNPLILGLGLVIGIVTTSMLLLKGVTMATAIAQGAMTLATNLSSASWWRLNAAMLANPYTWIVAGIIAIIALIGSAIYYFDEWGSSILLIMGPIGILTNGIMLLYRHWDSVKEAFQSDGIIGGLKRIGQVLLDTVMHPIQRILGWVGELADWDWAKNASKQVEDFRKSLNLVTVEEGQKKAGLWDTIKGKIGISSVNGVPGASTINSTIGGGKGEKEKSNTAVATGGTKHNYITINLTDLIGVLNINKEGFKESVEEMQEHSTDALLRLLGSAVSAGN